MIQTNYLELREMQFMPELKRYLRARGFIYTVRKYDMDSRLVYVEEVGNCKRIALGKINLDFLYLYSTDSGFQTPEDWYCKIKEINGNLKDFFLYKVEVLE